MTEETKSAGGAAKIPKVCEAFGVECIKLADLFAHEGVRY